MYEQLAHLYDWPGALDFSQKILVRDLGLLETLNIQPPAHIIDLACGTGTLTLEFAKHGFRMTGIDSASSMLEQAKAKQVHYNSDLEIKPEWQHADMRHFLVNEPADVVVCHYDSLNHLSNETELRATFLQVAQALKPGGLFLFDLNTLENYQTFWNGRDTYEGPNYQLKTQSGFNADSHKAEVHFLVQEYTDDGELMVREETVYEHYFNETAVEKYLMAAEFYDISWEPFNPVDDIPAEFPLKTFWRCQRR
jgi:2-polyprenyl-3-methyl-5-hydroxy-6-metoxy-1,4-benzoquinol methylase